MSEDRIPKYKIGDKVKLNVGGPDMAVKSISTNRDDIFTGQYRCQWFAGKKLDSGDFPEASLIQIEEP
ncbi:hypothetical protein F951_02188 [Acinetobacter soli CIP 110264]|uniref:YodC family protein n=1 Tax=Acinetobacter soli TaxID=487316 RepID=UPI0002CEAC64|nr:DUF2158 domain-containing protein [Acinetobacter soli]ENV56490.1 hypothetical protein F951_02188 [Acinetobacter soli CIP 110264]